MQIEEKIIKTITRLVAAFWILMKIISLKLWLVQRNYPLVPIVPMPAQIHMMLLGISFALAAWIIYKPQSRQVMIALILTEAVNILGDQNRLQPWHYQYLFTFFAIAANRKKQQALQAIVLITIATYLFSGLEKFNPGFIRSVWSIHILRRFLKVPAYIANNHVVRLSGFIIPLVEIGSAIGLLFLRSMKPAACTLAGMHIFLLLFLGPLGINYNVIVWPWNLQMMLLLYFIFIKNKIQLQPAVHKSAANIVVAFCWILLPVAGLFGYWDKFLSSGLYLGGGKLKQFYFADSSMIPKELKPYAFRSKHNSSASIIVTDWSVAELNVGAVTEPRLLYSITKQLNERYAAQHIYFELTEWKY